MKYLYLFALSSLAIACQSSVSSRWDKVSIRDVLGSVPLELASIDPETTGLKFSGSIEVEGYLSSRAGYPVLIDSLDGHCLDTGFAAILIDDPALAAPRFLLQHKGRIITLKGTLIDAYTPLSRAKKLDPGMVEIGNSTFFGPFTDVEVTKIGPDSCTFSQ